MEELLLDRYGPAEALRLGDLDEPVPGDRDVRVRAGASDLGTLVLLATTVPLGVLGAVVVDSSPARFTPS